MTTIEQRFMETVPPALRKIADKLEASRTRLVKVKNPATYINPNEIASLCVLPDDYADNPDGGRINITLRNDSTFDTFFKTADEAIKALGLGD